MEAYKCEESNFVTKCDCPDDLCNVNSNAGGKVGGGVPHWLPVFLVTVFAKDRLIIPDCSS